MPRWPEHDGLRARQLEGFARDGATYALAFDAAPAADGERVSLAFDGIATTYRVALNGHEILRCDSMFARHEVDVSSLLREQGNDLVIDCSGLDDLLASVPKRPRQRWRTKVVENGGALRFVRTSVIGRAPGFAPGPPAEGPWRPVWLVRRRGVQAHDVALRPRVEGDDGVLRVGARLGGGTAARVEVRIAGRSAPLAVAADRHVHGEVRVPGAARWWPHTHGEPALHDVALVVDDRPIGLGRIGFRALSPGAGFDVDRDDFALAVNGVPVFARGAVWTPVADAEEVRPTLQALRDAGINLIRIPGIGAYEDEAFHDACDELGLLVWQDFMFANLDYPIEDEAFRATVTAEARAELARVAGRPSLAVLCGNSEVEQQAAMFGVDPALGRDELFGALLPRLVRESGADVPYVPSAPSGGALPFHPRAGVANYFGVGGYRRPLSDARTAGVRFASECLALANLPDGRVADGEGVMRDAGADWDFADVRDHYLRERYGVEPDALRTTDRERYLALSRELGGDLMAAVFGEWRRAASRTAGGIVLWARDLAPGAGWGLLDHRGAPKVALAHLRRALAPTALWLVDEGLNGVDVHVANDGPAPLRARLHVALLAGGTHAIAEAEAELAVAPHGAQSRGVDALLGRFADPAYAYRFGAPQHDAVVATLLAPDGDTVLAQATHFPTRPPLEPTTFSLTATLTVPGTLSEGDAALTPRTGRKVPGTLSGGDAGLVTPAGRKGSDPLLVVCADRLAWGVRIHAPGFRPEDDAFTLAPGRPRTIALRPLREGATFAGATLTALNLIGERSVIAPDVAA